MERPKVEIERTSTSQGVPKTKHISQGNTTRSSVSESVPTVAQITPNPKSNHGTDFEPYVPVRSSNKRKRDSGSNSQDESSRPTGAAAAMRPAPEDENGLSNPVDERESRDLKKARKKERKERLKQDTGTGSQRGDEEGESNISTGSKSTRKMKTKEGKAAATRSDDETIAAPLSEDLPNGRESQSKDGTDGTKKKKKKKHTSIIETNGKYDLSDSQTVDEKHHPKKTGPKGKVDDDTKGGVAPIDNHALGPAEQSADQIEQQRPKSDIATDNDWLRAKTSRVLDLTDATPEYAKSVPTDSEDISNRPTAERDSKNTEQRITPFTDSSTRPSNNALVLSARLFVRNLPYTANESEIERLFSKYGHLDEVRHPSKPFSSFHDDCLIGTAYALQLMSFQREYFSRYLFCLIPDLATIHSTTRQNNC